jgi:hypothetical protein
MNIKKVMHEVVCDTESNVVFCEKNVASIKRENFDDQHSNCQQFNDFYSIKFGAHERRKPD